MVVLFTGGVRALAPLHDNSNWREAARAVRSEGNSPDTPVLYPSPFIEAQSPVWRPDYPLPGFLYCHLLIYPVGGTPYLLPYTTSIEAERYAASIAGGALASQIDS